MTQPQALAPSLSHEVDRARRFGGIARLYGAHVLTALSEARACVVGVGGVGSWAAEALARSGVGRLRLIDLDHVAESNINRQIHALEPTLGQAKVLAMRERIAAIDPGTRVEAVEEFLTADNAAAFIKGCDVVIDAIDNVRAKTALVLACRDAGVKLIVCGSAGGKTDPTRIRIDDLTRTEQDPLLAKLRKRLRAEHGFSRDPRRRFGIAAVYSDEPLEMPETVCDAGPMGLACAGYGSSMVVTASFGLFAASQALEVLAQVATSGAAQQ